MQQEERFTYLFEHYYRQECSSEEKKELFGLMEGTEHDAVLNRMVQELLENSEATEQLAPEASGMILDSIIGTAVPVGRVRSMRPWYWWAAAAAVVVVIASSVWLITDRDKAARDNNKIAAAHSILPGTNKAVLTLSNGKTIVLDNTSNTIAEQNGIHIINLSNGQLAYNQSDIAQLTNAGAMFNTLATPKGGQYQVVLPDGTHVWLNAASSLRYPVAFTGKERRVEITGEAYLEVAKDAAKPFLVSVNHQAAIEVLGTEFNVNAYDNEKIIRATLINGSIKVENVLLKAGQQAQVAGGNKAGSAAQPAVAVVSNVDLEKVTAWKNGLFNFEGASLEEVMKQLERWYNIEVVYENGIPNIRFIGEMSRQITLADLLEILKRTEVDFRIEEGRKLIVMNK